jgi:hypothetical protein
VTPHPTFTKDRDERLRRRAGDRAC